LSTTPPGIALHTGHSAILTQPKKIMGKKLNNLNNKWKGVRGGGEGVTNDLQSQHTTRVGFLKKRNNHWAAQLKEMTNKHRIYSGQ
jgi:hypothetical protein